MGRRQRSIQYNHGDVVGEAPAAMAVPLYKLPDSSSANNSNNLGDTADQPPRIMVGVLFVASNEAIASSPCSSSPSASQQLQQRSTLDDDDCAFVLAMSRKLSLSPHCGFSFSLFLRERARQTLEHRADLSTFCVKVR